MKISVGSDHRGVNVKARIVQILSDLGYQLDDQGAHTSQSSDYPDFAHAVAEQVASGGADLGILVCGTGIGMSMAANKTPGIRAALCHDVHDAEMSRRHNDANILCLGADRIEANPDAEFLGRLLGSWLHSEFEGGRHQRRVNKIARPGDVTTCNE